LTSRSSLPLKKIEHYEISGYARRGPSPARPGFRPSRRCSRKRSQKSIYLHNVARDHQAAFLKACGEHLLPAFAAPHDKRLVS
jgi:hypothetical protein